jgi:hypothetical protein
MKFKLLSIGQKFEYEGEIFVKTSPLVASNIKTGHNKMIPRYAVLNLLDDMGAGKPKVLNESVGAQEILNAFNLFYARCIETLETNNALIPKIKDELDKARDDFTQYLIDK